MPSPRSTIPATSWSRPGRCSTARSRFGSTTPRRGGAFPDQRNEIHTLRHADDAVVVEFDLLGTHLGAFVGFEPTGRTFRCRMAAIFEFDRDRIVCERIYFDAATILRQLGLLGG